MSESATDVSAWLSEATAELLAARSADGGWSYHAGQVSRTEPTALAVLALSAVSPTDEALPGAVDWLVNRQHDDGFFATEAQTQPNSSWATPLGAMALREQGRFVEANAAADALLAGAVNTFPSLGLGSVYGYNTSLPGWPWTNGDFSFVEPTALTMLFLKQSGHGDALRVRQGADYLRDRALEAGGWNYGEPEVLGGVLFPTILPTAMALLALADEQDASTTAGLAFLQGQRGNVSSLLSLGWTTIALNVLGVLDDDWRDDVVARWRELPAERRDPMETALCLLGMAEHDPHPFAIV